jgi:ATP-binding cassette subfamily B protein
MADARVLIFDDATSAVDAATEHGLRSALAEATRTRATLIISHRISSLMHADEIIVLDGGRVIERGDHASLLQAGGYYARLYAMQTAAAGEPASRQPQRISA